MRSTPAEHLGATSRALSTVVRDGVEHRLLTVSRAFAATREEVWDALVTPERIPRWLMPITGDLEVGGRFALEGNAEGEILTCERPERLAVTWEFGGHVSWVEVTMRTQSPGTVLQLDHTAPVEPEKWDEFGPGAVGCGWEGALLGLAMHLEQPEAPRPTEVPGLMNLFEVAGTAWGEAAVAAGEPAEEARAAARRCVAAYTGSTEDTDT